MFAVFKKQITLWLIQEDLILSCKKQLLLMKKEQVGSLHLVEYLTVELDFDLQLKRLTIIVEVRKRFCNIKLAHSFMAASRTIDR